MSQVNPNSKKRAKRLQNSLNQAARYSGLAFEMFFIILAGVFGGKKLDEILGTSPLLTAILALLGVFAAIYLAIKDFLRKNGDTKKEGG
jgi:F0F1-type ATP synthase assembly protein I